MPTESNPQKESAHSNPVLKTPPNTQGRPCTRTLNYTPTHTQEPAHCGHLIFFQTGRRYATRAATHPQTHTQETAYTSPTLSKQGI